MYLHNYLVDYREGKYSPNKSTVDDDMFTSNHNDRGVINTITGNDGRTNYGRYLKQGLVGLKV